MRGQHYISSKPGKARAQFLNVEKLFFYEASLVNLIPKVKYSTARAQLKPETQSRARPEPDKSEPGAALISILISSLQVVGHQGPARAGAVGASPTSGASSTSSK